MVEMVETVENDGWTVVSRRKVNKGAKKVTFADGC
jgi:hypothetical protein